MTSDALRDLCLSFRGSEETFPVGFETSVFKVAGKMFALSRLEGDPLSISLKCEPQLAEQLRDAHPCITAFRGAALLRATGTAPRYAAASLSRHKEGSHRGEDD